MRLRENIIYYWQDGKNNESVIYQQIKINDNNNKAQTIEYGRLVDVLC